MKNTQKHIEIYKTLAKHMKIQKNTWKYVTSYKKTYTNGETQEQQKK